MSQPLLTLKHFTFEELLTSNGLARLDQTFLTWLNARHPELHHTLIQYREDCFDQPAIKLSEFLIDASIALQAFLADFFDIQTAVDALDVTSLSHDPITQFKKFFVLRRAKKQLLKTDDLKPFSEVHAWLMNTLKSMPLQSEDLELSIGMYAQQLLSQPEKYDSEIEWLTQWCRHAFLTEEARTLVMGWTSFRVPDRIDHAALVPRVRDPETQEERWMAPSAALRHRDGFALTDPRMSSREVHDEVHYCIYCHDHEGDFCSKGFPIKKGDPTQGFKKNPLGVTLTGCPLDEKISEMQWLKNQGKSLAALAMIMIDNPLCPATGHRICNDCMKACIYQKQDPVNIPQIETRVLTDVLHLPWGVEIYDLLTRWHPLRQKQWVMKPYNGLKVMIAGMGPAGFTLAHHLLLEGLAVVGFDGLKIEPLPERYLREPIYQFNDIKESLDERLMAGFGGVAEYGITVRWDKNFLKLIYISLMRKPHFQVFGSTRFGGTITVEDAWGMGFDHFVIAVGAGLPKALSIPGSLAPGMRQANDFLMALQLGNAAKKNSLTNIDVRLPAVVIGGGLTGVDTATEIQAYYITQVEKILERYETLSQHDSEASLRQSFDPHSLSMLDEYLEHGRKVREERVRARQKKTRPDFIRLIREWGGVTIVYRRTMQESPAYIHNHEELAKALSEGIYYRELLEPVLVECDEWGFVKALQCQPRDPVTGEAKVDAERIRLATRSIFVATGTQPNIAYEFEHRGTFHRQGFQYQHYEIENDQFVLPHGIEHCKEKHFGPFTSYQKDHHRVTLIGDTHPVFHGNVVKAIASGMRTYPAILTLLKERLHQQGDISEYQRFADEMCEQFQARVVAVKRCTSSIIELMIKAPLAAKHFQPGHFYRLQNYETFSRKINETILQMEPMALVAAEVDREQGTLTFMIVEKGVTGRIAAMLQPGDAVSLMGPTGVRGKISHEKETVLIAGNVLSLPLLRSYGAELRRAGNRVMYYAIFDSQDEWYCGDTLSSAADVVLTHFVDHSQDNPFQRFVTYDNESADISLHDVDRIYVIGSPGLLRQFQDMRETLLQTIFIKNPRIFGSVYSSMQCMLKGVCAQCLQWQVDPETGHRTKAVFACSWPDQPLELIDLGHLNERLVQNRVQEILTNRWLDHLLKEI